MLKEILVLIFDVDRGIVNMVGYRKLEIYCRIFSFYSHNLSKCLRKHNVNMITEVTRVSTNGLLHVCTSC